MRSIGPAWIAPAALLLLGSLNSQAAEPISLRTLAKGAVSGIREAKEEVIRAQDAWEKIWSAHTSGRQPTPPLPQVDFAKEMVLVVTLGTRRSGGHAVEIIKAEPAQDKLRVSVVRTAPRPGAITLQALTAPFHMVAVSKSSLPAEFVEVRPSEESEEKKR